MFLVIFGCSTLLNTKEDVAKCCCNSYGIND